MRIILVVLFAIVIVAGVAGGPGPGRAWAKSLEVATPTDEPAWIRNGEPIQFEGENWYPTDEVENLMDNEFYAAGVYRDVPFFLEKTDVKPFDRIYTRFAKNRYRAFEKQE